MAFRLNKYFIVCIVLLVLTWTACNDDNDGPMVPMGRDLTDIPYAPVPKVLDIPTSFANMEIPADNPLTEAGVQLGRMLFYDPILSLDSTVACVSCHRQEFSFTDGTDVSIGIDGQTGTRSAMSLLNVGFHINVGFFWDGRSKTLEEQALEPIENPVEMGNTWEEVEKRLQRSEFYPENFRKAFGIKNSSEITRLHATKALAQFERTLISSDESEYDRFDRGEFQIDDEAQSGFELFFDDLFPDAECGHCHNGSLFTANEFKNNGLDLVNSVDDYLDKGFGDVTGDRSDNAKFKIPTLRNILLTAPYMHDGRFATIEEVLEHYNSGGHHVTNMDEDNVDNLMEPQGFSTRDKSRLIAFLSTLTDSTFINNPDFQSPF